MSERWHTLERAHWQQQVEQALADTYKPEGVRMWLTSRNRMLDMRVPQEMINAGEGEAVYALAYSLGEMIAT